VTCGLSVPPPARRPGWLIPALLGSAAAIGGIVVGGGDASAKGVMILLAGVIALAGLLGLARSGVGEPVLILGLALSIPINPTKNFLLQPHVGGAPGLQIQAAGLIMVLLYGALLVRVLARQPLNWRIDRTMAGAIAVYIATCVLSLAAAQYPAFTVFELVRLGEMFLAFSLVSQFRDERRANLFLIGLAIGTLIEASLAAYQYKTGHSLGLGFLGEDTLVKQNIGDTANRATGTIGHPNQLAYFFEILIPVFLAMALAHTRRALRVLFLVAFFAASAGILTTLSRAGWLTVPISVSIVFTSVVGSRIFSLRGGLLMVAASGVLLASLVLFYPTIEKRFTHNDSQSAQSRQPLNEAAFSIVKAHPLTGVGLNNFAEVFHQEDTTGFARVFRGANQAHQINHYKQVVHNLYLNVWAELGTIGLVAFLGQFAVAFSTVLRRTHNTIPQWQALRIAICAGLLAQLIHGLFDPGFKTTFNISLQVYCLLGLLAAANLGIQTTAPASRSAKSLP
jgi:putative inorganic carbon (hco3(-)) transporter